MATGNHLNEKSVWEYLMDDLTEEIDVEQSR